MGEFWKKHKGKILTAVGLTTAAAGAYHGLKPRTDPPSPTIQMMPMDHYVGQPENGILDSITSSIRSGDAFADIPGVRVSRNPTTGARVLKGVGRY
jgi:hypothetical protein